MNHSILGHPLRSADGMSLEARMFEATETTLDPERREWLIRKGQLLYGKYCGTKGQGICAENFVLYHLNLGEIEVARDFLGFLRERLEHLTQADPEGRLAMTQRLAERVERHLLESEGD